MVTPCIPTCEPAVCDVLDFGGQIQQEESYGRRKREVLPTIFDFGSSVVPNTAVIHNEEVIRQILSKVYTKSSEIQEQHYNT